MNDPLFGNKLAAAGLTALLIFFGLPQLASSMLGGGHHGSHGEELHLAYPIDYKANIAAGPVKEEKPIAMLMAETTVDQGERRSAVCKSCHTFEKGGRTGTGPNLWDIVNRPVASVPGFGYSNALKEFGGNWTFERLDRYLENSQSYISGTAMVQRIPRDDHRAALLVYLGSLSDNPAPMPAVPAEAAEEVPTE